MSKFCGVKSNQQMCKSPSPIEEPLTFEMLQVIVESLQNEIDPLNDDFGTKTEFVNDQQTMIIKNEEALVKMNNQLVALHNSFNEVERNVYENDVAISHLDRCVSALERAVLHTDVLSSCSIYTEKQQSEHQYALDQFKHINVMMEDLKILMEDMAKDDRFRFRNCGPYKNIIAILYGQVFALMQIEENVNALVERVGNVDGMFMRALETIAMKLS